MAALTMWAATASYGWAASLIAAEPLRLDERQGPCSGVALAAVDPQWVAVGWTVDAGSTHGVFVRLRRNLLWGAALRLDEAADDAREPRDLALAVDARGRLHAVWTARTAEGRTLRRVVLDVDSGPPRAAPAPIPDAPGTQADFPQLRAAADGSLLLVWQQSRELAFGIEAAWIDPDGYLRPMGRVSGAAPAALAPQILSAEPPRVAWSEVGAQGVRLRIEAWNDAEARWQPSAWERVVDAFPSHDDLLLFATPEGLAAAWRQSGPGALEALLLGWVPWADPATPRVRAIDPEGGDPRRPSLAGRLPEGLTVAWERIAPDRRRVELARGLAPDAADRLVVSPPAHRFASRPAHATFGRWSAVVWIDDAREGGDGGVYFNEVRW